MIRIQKISLLFIGWASALGAGCSAEGLEGEEPIGETQQLVIHSPANNLPQGFAEYGSQWANGQPALDLVSIGNSACFINLVGGAFTSTSDKVQIINNGSKWQLTGTSVSGNVQARAFCVTDVAPDRAGTWQPGQGIVDLGVANGRTCFLTGVWGNLSGVGKEVRIKMVNGRWQLDGNGVSGSATCIPRASFSPIDLGISGSTSSLAFANAINPSSSGPTMCSLTRVSGLFRTGGSIQVYNLHTQNTPPRYTWRIITTLNNIFPFPIDSPTGSGRCVQ